MVAQKTQKFNTKKRKWYDIVLSVIIGIVFAITLCFVVFSIIFVKVEVVGVSMQPTYNQQLPTGLSREEYKKSEIKDKVYVNRFSNGKRGDIIVVKSTENGETVNVIKRLVAVGGDSVDIKLDTTDNKYYLYVNGEKQQEDYIKTYQNEDGTQYNDMKTCYDNFVDYKQSVGIDSQDALVLQDDEIFILGDNRGKHSKDSSVYGPVKKSNIVGKVTCSVPYNSNFISYIIFGIGR